MPASLAELAPAKVNLCLHVTGRRDDGYHLLDSIAVFPDCGDRLSVSPDAAFGLSVTGPFASGLDGEGDNLVLRAGRMLGEAAGVRPHGRLLLDKRLPVASGIGGGSADAAAALRLLQRFWNVSLPETALQAMALSLGADVPVCLRSQPARMEGIGERLTPLPALPRAGMVLVNPGEAVATPAVFRARPPGFSPALESRAWPDARALAADLARFGNDLEAPALSLCPAIGVVLAALRAHPACLLARMSGSGATCFALCEDAGAARSMAAGVARAGWWSWGGDLAASPLAAIPAGA